MRRPRRVLRAGTHVLAHVHGEWREGVLVRAPDTASGGDAEVRLSNGKVVRVPGFGVRHAAHPDGPWWWPTGRGLRIALISAVLTAVGSIATVVAVTVPAGSTAPTKPKGAQKGGAAPAELRVTLDVRNDATRAEPDTAGRLQKTDSTQPTIFVNLRNDGRTGTAIDRIELTLSDETEIRFCDPRGGETIQTWRTGVPLPEGLTKGDTVTPDRPVAYNVAADDAGRFALELKPDEALLRSRRMRLYRFDVRLRQVSSGRRLDAGAAVVLLPGVWPPDFDGTGGPLWSTRDGASVDVYAPCVATNRRTLKRIAAGAELSSRLRSFVH